MVASLIQTLTLGGKRFVVIPEAEFKRLVGRDNPSLPSLPEPDELGDVAAVEYARASLARKIIASRKRAGLSRAELARRAGVRPETLNRIEKGRNTPDTATLAKISKALDRALG